MLSEVKTISAIASEVLLQLFIACCWEIFLQKVSFMMEQLKSLYYDPKLGYQSISKIKTKIPDVSTIDIKNFLQQQNTFQLNKEAKRPTCFNTINASYPGQNFQIDIMIYDRFEADHYGIS